MHPATTPLAEQFPSAPNRIYYPALDGLRAIAVTFVFLQHYIIPNIPTAAFSWGWVGVDIFFVLSGFLITGILFDSRALAHRFRNFYVRRALRIFPLYYGIFLLLLLLTPVLRWNWSALWLLWPVYLGNLARFLSFSTVGHMGTDSLQSASDGVTIYLGHFWSLCVEEQFYLLWPVLVFLIGDRRRLLRLCAIVIVGSPVLRWAALLTVPAHLLASELIYRLLPFRADALLIGAALALLQRSPSWARLRSNLRWYMLAVGVAFLLTRSIAIYVLHESSAPAVTTPWISVLGFSLIDLFSAGVIALCLTERSAFSRLLSAAPLVFLGRISYGFYVLHDIPHGLYARLIGSLHPTATSLPFWTALLAYPATVLLATLSFRCFEQPILRYKERFTLRSTVPFPHA